MIDFALSDSQKALQQGARAFAKGVLGDASKLYSGLSDQGARFRATRPIYQQAFKAGLVRGQIPAPLGGTATGTVDAALVVEEFYSVNPGVSLTILGTGLGLTPLILAGSPEQHGRLLKPFLAEEGDALAALVHSEPGGTANWLEKGGKGLQATAMKDGDDWIINGDKYWTTNSGGWEDRGAALQCVVCRLVERPDEPQSPDVDPVSLVLIIMVTAEDVAANPPEAYQVLGHPELAGHPASSGPHSRFTNFRAQGRNLLAPPGKGAAVIEATFGASAALVGAMATGLQRAAFEAALAFARTETSGGTVPIVERQSPADLLIDIKMRTETSRLLTWKGLHALDRATSGAGHPTAWLELTLEAKVFSTDAAVRSVVDAMKVVGMRAYERDGPNALPLARMLDDAACLPLFDGGNVGIRRRQIERIFAAKDYDPWAATF